MAALSCFLCSLSHAISLGVVDTPQGFRIHSILLGALDSRRFIARELQGLQGLSISQSHRPDALRGLGIQGIFWDQEVTGIHIPGRTPLQGWGATFLLGGLGAGGYSVHKVPALWLAGCCCIQAWL